MKTKPAIRSAELWILWSTFFTNNINKILENPDMLSIFGDKRFLAESALVVSLILLRTLKTSSKIKGWFRSPADIQKIHPPAEYKKEPTAENILTEELQANDDYLENI